MRVVPALFLFLLLSACADGNSNPVIQENPADSPGLGDPTRDPSSGILADVDG